MFCLELQYDIDALKNAWYLCSNNLGKGKLFLFYYVNYIKLSDTVIFLEDCPTKDMRAAFVEYIHQVFNYPYLGGATM